MTDEEKANDYELECVADVYEGDACSIPYAYSGQKLERAYLDGLAEGRKELEKENAELESDLESEARAAGELESQVEALEEELQAERYMLKCRDDELSEARAELSMAETQRNLLDQKLRRAETKLRLVLSDFLALKPAFYIGYGDELEKRAQEKEALEDLCDKEREEKMRQEAEEEKRHVND